MPERQNDFDQAWARIVEELSSGRVADPRSGGGASEPAAAGAPAPTDAAPTDAASSDAAPTDSDVAGGPTASVPAATTGPDGNGATAGPGAPGATDAPDRNGATGGPGGTTEASPTPARGAEPTGQQDPLAPEAPAGPGQGLGTPALDAPTAGVPTAADSGEQVDRSGLAALFDHRSLTDPEPPDDPGAFVANWADEGHFTPPPPPEIPAGTPLTRLAWTGLLAGPTVLALLAMTGWPAPPIVAWGAGLAALAGFITLVWQLPDTRSDGWDDGAQL